jgi:magnesium chelatase subunit D
MARRSARTLFPFAAIEGQDDLKEALLITAVNPAAGGVLIRGEKGTAKSTAARGLIEILPEIPVRPGCAYSCDPGEASLECEWCAEHHGTEPVLRPAPFLTLPLNATEDRVTGGLDFERALATGERRNAPGLLAAAHRGILYIDEVNLLDDHIVDVILDAAASGWNILEREGVSYEHPARFILVGTMNPEEGDLRPQFLDRFGLSVTVAGLKEVDARVDLILRREEFDRDPQAFRTKYQRDTEALRRKLMDAKRVLPSVRIPKRVKGFIASLCAENHVAGHRADLFLAEAARAVCALEGFFEVEEELVLRISPLVLAHRRRDVAPPPPPPPPEPEEQEEEEPPEPPEPEDENKDEDEKKEEEKEEPKDENPPPPPPPEAEEEDNKEDTPPPPPPDQEPDRKDEGAIQEEIFAIGDTYRVRKMETQKDRLRRRGSGRRSRSRASQKQGRYVKSGPNLGQGDIALDATLRAAAPYQITRDKNPDMAISLEMSDIRERIREKKMGNHLFFMVDASGSMGARGRMTASKGAIMSLLLDAYQKRDQVALISFRRQGATVNLPLTTSVDMAGKLLAEMPVGGRTPLSAGLASTYREVRNTLIKNPLAKPIVILITDGRGNVSLEGESRGLGPFEEALKLARAMASEERVKYAVVDTEEPGIMSFGLAVRLAEALGADYFKTEDLKAETLVDIVKGEM